MSRAITGTTVARDNGIPIIRISIEGMQAAILNALSQHDIDRDAYVQDALKRYLDAGELQRQIDRHVSDAIDEAIKRETESYFKYGEGRKFIAKAVAAKLGAE